jgi:hypothetical protein
LVVSMTRVFSGSLISATRASFQVCLSAVL